MNTNFLLRGPTLVPISKDHSSYLKGIAILMIVLHNYYKWVYPITGENEFWFSAGYIGKALISLRSDPSQFFNVFFSFLGFYGVQVFMVISAYGLASSWSNKRPGYGRFILHRFDKLYPSLFLAALFFILITVIREGRMPGTGLQKDLLYQLALVPGKPTGISGPWWFYSFIFQFYIVFPLMFLINRKAGVAGLLLMTAAGYLVTILLYDPMLKAGFNPYSLFIGHMPEFCLGILLATREKIRVPWFVAALAGAMLILGNLFKWAWPFANLSAALLLLLLIQWMWTKRGHMKRATLFVSFTGAVSMYLFASHGLVRNGFINFANYLGSGWTAALIALAFLVFSLGISWLLMQTENSFRSWIRGAGSRLWKWFRFLVVILPVIGGMLLLFMEANSTDRLNQKPGIPVFSVTNDFENLSPERMQYASRYFYQSGKQGLVLPPPDSFTPNIDAEPDGKSSQGLYEAAVTARLFATDTGAQCHVVLEVIDIATHKILEWKSTLIRPDKFPQGKWFTGEFRYPVPPDYRHKGFRFRAFIWNKGTCTIYVDDLKLELLARR